MTDLLGWTVVITRRDGSSSSSLNCRHPEADAAEKVIYCVKNDKWLMVELGADVLAWSGFLLFVIMAFVVFRRGHELSRTEKSSAIMLLLWFGAPTLMFAIGLVRLLI